MSRHRDDTRAYLTSERQAYKQGMSRNGYQDDDGRQHGGRARRLPGERGLRHLSDHAVIDHGGTRRPMVLGGCEKHLGQRAGRPGNAERRWSGGSRAWRTSIGGADDDIHRLAGPHVDAAEYAQDRRRTHFYRVLCGRPIARYLGVVDFRRPFRRDDGSHHGFCLALLSIGAGGA